MHPVRTPTGATLLCTVPNIHSIRHPFPQWSARSCIWIYVHLFESYHFHNYWPRAMRSTSSSSAIRKTTLAPFWVSRTRRAHTECTSRRQNKRRDAHRAVDLLCFRLFCVMFNMLCTHDFGCTRSCAAKSVRTLPFLAASHDWSVVVILQWAFKQRRGAQKEMAKMRPDIVTTRMLASACI